jgi:hypothetical protein
MLTYAIDGHILTLTAVGSSTAEHRIATFTAIRTDPNVPPGALLLVNARETTEPFDHGVLSERIALLIDALGPKLADVCAVVGPSSYLVESYLFQTIAARSGLRVGLFKDESSAVAWLSAYLPVPGT